MKLVDGTVVALRYASDPGYELEGEVMATLEDMREFLEELSFPGELDHELLQPAYQERKAVLRFIREQATKGTADLEHKLTKLADAIERGEHEA